VPSCRQPAVVGRLVGRADSQSESTVEPIIRSQDRWWADWGLD
jgi:hypothetical protein